MPSPVEVVQTNTGEQQSGLDNSPVYADNVWTIVLCSKPIVTSATAGKDLKGGLPQPGLANIFTWEPKLYKGTFL